MRSEVMDTVRRTVEGLCPTGRETVTLSRLFQALGAKEAPERARIRSRLSDLCRKNELLRVETGVYRPNPAAVDRRQGEGRQRVWRAVRGYRPGWSVLDVVQVTRMSRSMVSRYCKWLEAEEFIARAGRMGNTILYRLTAKGREHPRVPRPPKRMDHLWQAERTAALHLAGRLPEGEPHRPENPEKMAENRHVLPRRFERPAGEERRDQ